MDKLKDIELYLGNNLAISNLKKSVYEEELKVINDKDPVNESRVTINKTYIFKKQNALEVGVFIRNGLNHNIAFEKIGLVLSELDGDIIAEKMEDLKGKCIIPPRSAVPLIIEFPLQEVKGYDESKEYVIQFNDVDSMKAFGARKVDIMGIDDNTTFEEEHELRSFNESLPTLKVDEFNIATFKITQVKDNNLSVSLFFRNATEKAATIKVLPILVVDKQGSIVAQGIFNNPEGVIKVESGKAVLQSFVVPCSVSLDSEIIKTLAVKFQ